MIDFFWLKSFTEILQLFLSVFFIIYLNIKYTSDNKTIKWLSIFFYIKLITDLYGILNYTSWISSILTKPILEFYRVTMGALEVGMLLSLFIFVHSLFKKEVSLKQGLPYFGLAVVMLPINIILRYVFNFDLILPFDLVKILWILTALYLIVNYIKNSSIKLFFITIVLWNALWLAEVILHHQLMLINEPLSWTIFVISELIFTMGIAYFFIQVVINPKILKFENIHEVMPNALRRMIESNLDSAIKENKLYLRPDLNLNILAKEIHASPSDLTIYLNKILNKNFNQFIIDHRIEESKLLLNAFHENKLNIEQVMYASGFNSKSVFNTAFKNRTGMTPSQYKKLHKN
ncbi:helix-turn-helix domain-containing protein [Tenacibaculum xiamenense]|uniref:helix-turn-helix domain-containing protein n=1 Tax=Tenacibaculum xiamenense TaxID=1261553 RepID=UPI0038961EDA